jgi:hypothetical protein
MPDEIAALIVKLQADVAQLKSDLQAGRSELASFKTDAEAFGSSLVSAFKWGLAIVGVYELGSAIKNAFKMGIEAVDSFQLTTIGVAATITDLAKDQSKGQQNYAQALAYSKDMYQELELAAARYFASGTEMVQAWNIMAQKGVVLRKEEIDSLGVIVDRVKLSTQGQVASYQIAQEIRALLNGEVNMHAQVAMLLKDRIPDLKKQIELHRQSGDIIHWLAEQFKGLKYASVDIENTLESQRSTLGTLLTQVGRGGLAGAYEDIVDILRKTNDWLITHKKEISYGIVMAWEQAKSITHEIIEGIRRAKNLLSEPISWVINIVGSAAGFLANPAGHYAPQTQDMKDLVAGFGGGNSAPPTSSNLREILRKQREEQAWAGAKLFPIGGVMVPMDEVPFIPDTKLGAGDKGGKGGGDKSRVAAWQAELEEMKAAEENYFNFSKQRELEFWQDKLALVEEGSNEETQLKHKIFAVKKEMARQELQEDLANLKLQQQSAKLNGDQRLAIQDQILARLAAAHGKESKEYLDAEREKVKIAQQVEAEKVKIAENGIEKRAELRKIDLDIERENLNFKRQMNGLSEAQEIAGLIRLKKKEYEIYRQALEDKRLLLEKSGMQQTEAYADLLEKRKLLEKKETLDLTKLNNQRTLALKKQWDQLWSSVSRAFTMSLQGIITGTTTLKEAMANIFQSILASFVEMVTQMALEYIAAQLFKMMFGEETTNAQIMQQGGIAYMENVVALIPKVGPFAAPVAAGVLTGAEIATAKAIASAEGGMWRVPHELVTILHPKETVLPAWAAESWRQIVSGGGLPQPAKGQPDRLHMKQNINVVTPDGRTILKQNKTLLFDLVKQGIKHGEIPIPGR